MRLVFEEPVQQILMPELGNPSVLFTAEYSGADESAEITVDYGGKPYDIEKTGNTLSLKLLRGAVSGLDCETTDHGSLKNRIVVRI